MIYIIAGILVVVGSKGVCATCSSSKGVCVHVATLEGDKKNKNKKHEELSAFYLRECACIISKKRLKTIFKKLKDVWL